MEPEGVVADPLTGELEQSEKGRKIVPYTEASVVSEVAPDRFGDNVHAAVAHMASSAAAASCVSAAVPNTVEQCGYVAMGGQRLMQVWLRKCKRAMAAAPLASELKSARCSREPHGQQLDCAAGVCASHP